MVRGLRRAESGSVRFLIIVLVCLLPVWARAEISSKAIENLKISPATTLITGPLLPNGLPDYNGYMNKKYQVSSEQNAAAAFFALSGYHGKPASAEGETKGPDSQGICRDLHRVQGLDGYLQWLQSTAYWQWRHSGGRELLNHGGQAGRSQLSRFSEDPSVSHWLETQSACLDAFTDLMRYDRLTYPYPGDSLYAQGPGSLPVLYVLDGLSMRAWSAVAAQNHGRAATYFLTMLRFGGLVATDPGLGRWQLAWLLFDEGIFGLKYLAKAGLIPPVQRSRIRKALVRTSLPSLDHYLEADIILRLRQAMAEMTQDMVTPNPPLAFIVRWFQGLHPGLAENTLASLGRLTENLNKRASAHNRMMLSEAPAPISLNWLCWEHPPKNYPVYMDALQTLGFVPGDLNCENREHLIFTLRTSDTYTRWKSAVSRQMELIQAQQALLALLGADRALRGEIPPEKSLSSGRLRESKPVVPAQIASDTGPLLVDILPESRGCTARSPKKDRGSNGAGALVSAFGTEYFYKAGALDAGNREKTVVPGSESSILGLPPGLPGQGPCHRSQFELPPGNRQLDQLVATLIKGKLPLTDLSFLDSPDMKNWLASSRRCLGRYQSTSQSDFFCLPESGQYGMRKTGGPVDQAGIALAVSALVAARNGRAAVAIDQLTALSRIGVLISGMDESLYAYEGLSFLTVANAALAWVLENCPLPEILKEKSCPMTENRSAFEMSQRIIISRFRSLEKRLEMVRSRPGSLNTDLMSRYTARHYLLFKAAVAQENWDDRQSALKRLVTRLKKVEASAGKLRQKGFGLNWICDRAQDRYRPEQMALLHLMGFRSSEVTCSNFRTIAKIIEEGPFFSGQAKNILKMEKRWVESRKNLSRALQKAGGFSNRKS